MRFQTLANWINRYQIFIEPYWRLNSGTTGGAGGTTTTVSTYAQFTAAVAGTAKKVVVVSGPITKTADQVKVGSNTSIIGASSKAVFTGFGLLVKGMSNVVIRNIAIAKVLAANGDAIGIRKLFSPMIQLELMIRRTFNQRLDRPRRCLLGSGPRQRLLRWPNRSHPRRRLHHSLKQLHPWSLESFFDRPLRQELRRR